MSRLSDFVSSFIAGKKICLLGFGREGRSTYNYFKNIGGFDSITVCDLSPVGGLDGAEAVCGQGYQKNLDRFDIVMKSPGVVLEEDALSDGAKLSSQTELFLAAYREKIVGVTGTKGKSTTASLIRHVLKGAGINARLLGNIGVPPFDGDDCGAEAIVLEMSSHQLEFCSVSPHIAVFLNIFPEHLDHYGTFEKYYDAKKNIYRFQKEGDILIAHESIAPEHHAAESVIFGKEGDILIKPASFTYFGEEIKLPEGSTKLPGAHNVNNIAASYAVCRRFGIDKERFLPLLSTFEPLPHRLQNLGVKDGVTYFDDSISTIAQTAIEALSSLQNVGTLLVGGMDRGVDYSPLLDFLETANLSNVIFMYDTGRRLLKELDGRSFGFKAYFASDLKEAVRIAKEVTPKGSVCLLSPAAASYGFFKNFEERGDKFKEYVFAD